MKTSNQRVFLPSVLLCAASAFVISCETRPKLEPGEAGEMGKDAVRATASGVTVLAEGSEWSGRDEVKGFVTPLKVEIRNQNDQPIRIRYQQFALVTESGQSFSALPLFEIEGTVSEPKAISYARTPYQRRFYGYGFFPAPYYASVYPDTEPYPYAYDYSADAYRESYDYWKNIELPTQRMQETALPEGSITSGGEVRGHLFFEKVPGELNTVELQFDLVNAQTGGAMNSIELPLRVVE